MSEKLSFVVPIYNEAPTLEELVGSILLHAGTRELEILLVDDGSTDESPKVMRELEGKIASVKSIQLGEHRGKTEALKAGFERASGAVVLTMDSDLQDDPADIAAFLARLNEGFDLVCGWKQDRRDSQARVRASAFYNGVVSRIFGLQLRDVNCGFKAMRLEVARTLVPLLKRDYHRLIPVIAQQKGFKIGEVPVTHHERRHGRSKYGLGRYFSAFRDVVGLKLGL